MRQRFIYPNGKAVPCGAIPMRGTPYDLDKPFQAGLLDMYRELEAKGQYHGHLPKGYVKRIHEEALARDTHNGIH